LTIEQEIEHTNPALTRTQVRNICGTMMFGGDLALKKVSVLSGGEKSRTLLGKILAHPSNLLLLDEPNNHLDMESIDALTESLQTSRRFADRNPQRRDSARSSDQTYRLSPRQSGRL
jgi:ATP-binding cassette subfamily F protein 3